MDLFFDRPHSMQILILKNQKEEPFSIVYNSMVHTIPPGTVFRCPSDHYSAIMQQPGANGSIIILDPAKGTAEYLESEKKRKIADVEEKRRALEMAQQQLKDSEDELKMASTKLGLKVPGK